MLIDIGFAPIITLLIAAVALAVLADFLLELVSVRLTLSTGRYQNWLFDRFGRGQLQDILIAIAFQFISFRKRAFFMQLSSFVNVGSFNKRQTFSILIGSFIGMGLSVSLLMLVHPIFGITVSIVGFVMTFFSKEQLKDSGIALLNFGLLMLSIYFFNQFLMSSPFSIHQIEFQQPFLFGVIIFTSIFFRTPIAFLLTLSMIHFLIGLNSWWLPLAYFAHSLFFFSKYYFYFIKRHKRLFTTLYLTLGLQFLHVCVSFLLVYFFHEKMDALLAHKNFIASYISMISGFIIYFSVSLIISMPLLYLILFAPFLDESDKKKAQTQKILSLPQRGNLFSLHFSLFLLRQEFIKFSTLVHTIFKLGREADAEQETINKKLTHYQRILIRVGDEIKELCFSVGKQRSYRWHVQEILSFYKSVNQLELLVDDLSRIFTLLQDKDLDEEWEKECRYWLNLQLITFESFLNFVVGVGKDDPAKVKAHVEKSYEVLERLFAEEISNKKIKLLSKNFYRVTESNGQLTL